MRSEDRAKKTQQPKKASAGKVVEIPTKTSAKQRRHEHRMQKAHESRATNGRHEAQAKIDKKREQRRRFAKLSPSAKAEARRRGEPSRTKH